MAKLDPNGATSKYIYGKGLLAAVTTSGRYCYHFNGTGSTVALTDQTQAVVNSYAYDPFGEIVGRQETFPQPFKFVGQYGVIAEPNGLYYMRARYYDPSVGRFISEDPLGLGGGDVNLFAYVRNNPVLMIDPGGLLAEIARIDAGSGGGAGSADFLSSAPTGLNLFQLGWNAVNDMFYSNFLGRGQDALYGEIPIGGPAGLTGQFNRAISAQVYRALERNPSLVGLYSLRDSRFVTQAKDLACHNGYQWLLRLRNDFLCVSPS